MILPPRSEHLGQRSEQPPTLGPGGQGSDPSADLTAPQGESPGAGATQRTDGTLDLQEHDSCTAEERTVTQRVGLNQTKSNEVQELVERPIQSEPGGSGLMELGEPLPLQAEDTDHISEPPFIPGAREQTLRRLVNGIVPRDELPSVIESIVLNVKAAEIVKCLQRSDAQTFVDVVDKVCVALRRLWRTD